MSAKNCRDCGEALHHATGLLQHSFLLKCECGCLTPSKPKPIRARVRRLRWVVPVVGEV